MGGAAAVLNPVALIGTAIGGGGQAYSAYKGAEARKDASREQQRLQDKAARIKRRQAQRERVREVRRQLRENRAARASVVNQGAQTGVSDSSLVQGTQGRLQTQLGSNLGILDTEFNTQSSLFDLGMQSNSIQSNLEQDLAGFQQISAVSELGGKIGSFAMGKPSLFSSGGSNPRANPNMNGPR